MIFERFLRPKAAKVQGERLYAAAVAQARSPGLYARLGAPDTPDGRFEVYTLHVALLVVRLRAEGPAVAELNQSLFDAYLSGLDHGLRELGVGDLSVGKTMRKFGEAFYGRAKTLEAALADGDRTALEGLLARGVFAGAEGAPTGPFADYVTAARQALADADLAAVVAGEIAWPTP